MTGHDLDLDARAAEHYESVGSNHRCRICSEWSPCTVEALRAKLAAAEQERDAARCGESFHKQMACEAIAERDTLRRLCERFLPPQGKVELRLALAAAEQRQQERTVGRCGNPGPRIGNDVSPICALPAGHAGWHRGDESWTHGVTFAPEWRGPEPTLPANWFERDGLTDDGSRFAYCDAEGPEQAHCVLAQRHGGDHQWAWFTREQRARAEQDEPTGCLGDCGWKHCRPPCPQASQPEPTPEQP